MAEHHPHTVLREMEFLAESEHEHFGLPPGDTRDPGAVPVKQHVPLGARPNGHLPGRYLPGQTVHLTREQAAELVASGHVAPPGAALRYEMRLDSEL